MAITKPSDKNSPEYPVWLKAVLKNDLVKLVEIWREYETTDPATYDHTIALGDLSTAAYKLGAAADAYSSEVMRRRLPAWTERTKEDASVQ